MSLNRWKGWLKGWETDNQVPAMKPPVVKHCKVCGLEFVDGWEETRHFIGKHNYWSAGRKKA